MFNILLTQPLFNALVFLYEYVTFQDLGLAIILLTIIIRIILFPLFYKSFRNQTLLQKLQPQIQKIQHDHKHDREKQAKAMLEMYRQHKVNPFSGFLLILAQLPILIALYKVFFAGLTQETLQNLYSFIPAPENLNNLFLGLINLSDQSIIVVAMAAVFQYLHGRLSLPKTKLGEELPQALKMTKQMVWMGPILTVVILFKMPAAVGLYWLTTSLFSLIQQVYINKRVYGEDQINNSGNIKAGRLR